MDASIAASKPVAVISAKGGTTKLSLFRYALEIQ
jgi:hypothetical protein